LAFVRAPFDHTHDRDPDHEHATGFAHVHTGSSNSEHLSWNSDDGSDARSKNWLLATGKSPIPFHALLPNAVSVPEPARQAATVAEPTPQNHDPPWARGLGSRAPPA
jgi:LmbE family N-acetylglucosaminyl deacetylase